MSQSPKPPADTYGGLIRANAARLPERPAIIFEGLTCIWRELDRIVDTYARALLASGVRRESMVAIHCANRPEWLYVALGCARIGARLGPLNTFHREAEIVQQMQHSQPEILLLVDRIRRNDYRDMWQRLLPELTGGATHAGRFALFPTLREVIQLRGEILAGATPLQAWLAAGAAVTAEQLAAAEALVQPSDDLFIMYTSGSTGIPKGVRMVHGDILGNDFKLGERQGLTEQSRRHAVILSLLRVPHLVLAVNKMDLVDFSQEVYDKIHNEFTQFATKLNIPDLVVIPISALAGDNVVNRSENMSWYSGPTLMHHLEHVHVASDRDLVDVRFPVQYVVRPKSDEHHDYRGYGGMVAGGVAAADPETVVREARQIDHAFARPQPTATSATRTNENGLRSIN